MMSLISHFHYIMQKFTALHIGEVFKYLELDPDSHVQKALVLYGVQYFADIH